MRDLNIESDECDDRVEKCKRIYNFADFYNQNSFYNLGLGGTELTLEYVRIWQAYILTKWSKEINIRIENSLIIGVKGVWGDRGF